MQEKVKTKNGKKLQVEVLVNSEYTYTGINKQLVKNKRIQTKPVDFSFKVFNADGTKNGEVTRIALLKIKINGHKEYIKAAVMDLNRMDIFLGHDWLVKHNLEINQKEGKKWFTRCPRLCKTKHQDIKFKIR